MAAALRHRRRPRRRQRRADPRAGPRPRPRRGAGARRRPAWSIGRDTRVSGPLLEAALAAGFAAEGVDVELARRRARRRRVAFVSDGRRGVPAPMISASHNPFADNGIKLFAPGGRKLPDDVEEAHRGRARAGAGRRASPTGPSGDGVGTHRRRGRTPAERYVDHLVGVARRPPARRAARSCSTAPTGPRTAVAPRSFERLGADGRPSSTPSPTARNINDALRLDPPGDARRPRSSAAGADAGLAFDGDADRLIAVDHTGSVVDGDHIIAICALDLHARGAAAATTPSS